MPVVVNPVETTISCGRPGCNSRSQTRVVPRLRLAANADKNAQVEALELIS